MGYQLSPTRTMEKILAEWRPKSKDARRKEPKTEKEYENSLKAHLESALPNLQILKQPGARMMKGDLLIRRRTGLGFTDDIIELKKGLRTPRALATLEGQLRKYQPGQSGRIVHAIICGDQVERALLKELKQDISDLRGYLTVFHKRCKKGVERIL